MNNKVILIEFDDPCHGPGWVSNEEVPKTKDLRCFAVGFEIERTKKYITIAEAISKYNTENEDKLNPLTFEMKNVRNIKTLVPKTIKRKKRKVK